MSIINAAKSNASVGYCEKHHIIPRCLGGQDGLNIVKLSARQHYVCHRLLVKMTAGKAQRQMIHAIWMLANRHTTNVFVSSSVYEKLKISKSLIMLGNRIAAGKHSQQRIEANSKTQRIAQNRIEVKQKTAATKSTIEFREKASMIMKSIMKNQKTRDKIAQKHNKSISQFDVNGSLICVYKSAKEASLATGANRSCISNCVHNKRKSAGGFIWKLNNGGIT